MERTNKYYGIIENLVRKHKKFPGYESIIDEIIDDVYSHSEVIINSINNDSVINAYLEKVISTSIITVPKKLKFIKETSKNIVSEAAALPKVNTELVDRMINTAPAEDSRPESLVFETICENNTDSSNSDDELLESLNFEQEDEVDVQEDDTEIEALQDEAELIEELENLELPIEEECVSVESPEACESDSLTFEEELSENIEPKQILTEEASIEEADVVEEIDLQDASIIDDAVPELDLDSSEEIHEIENVTSDTPDLDINSELLEETSDSIEILEDDLVTEDILSESPVEDTIPSLDEASDQLEPLEAEDIEEPVLLEDKPIKAIDFSVFDYTPENDMDMLDVKEVTNEIEELNIKRPELNIIKVFNLKYKEKHSVAEISNELDMNKDSVLEALSEIIAAV